VPAFALQFGHFFVQLVRRLELGDGGIHGLGRNPDVSGGCDQIVPAEPPRVRALLHGAPQNLPDLRVAVSPLRHLPPIARQGKTVSPSGDWTPRQTVI
jgi:hypothetical protein